MRACGDGPLGVQEVRRGASRDEVRMRRRPQVRRTNPPRFSTLRSKSRAEGRSSGVGHYGDGRMEDAFDVSPLRHRQ